MILPPKFSSNHLCGPSSPSFGFSSIAVALITAMVLSVFSGLSQATPQKDKKRQPIASSSSMAPDKGKFKIFVDGQTVGSEEFEITPSGGVWVAHGTSEIEAPGVKHTRITSTFRLRSDGIPERYEWSSQGEKKASGSVNFQGGVATVQLDMGGTKPFDEQHTFGSPLIAILDNNLYHHYAILARLYDWNKKGPQTFPVLIPQDITPGTIAVEASGKETVEGASYETLKLTTPDLAVVLYLDPTHRLVRLAVPASKATVIRQ